MKALKCDICNGYFDSISSRRAITKKTFPNRVEIGIVCNNGNYDNIYAYDICPDCYAAIKKAIDDRRKRGVDPFDDDLK